MAGFGFRLQKLLDLRIQKEEESKIEFKKSQDVKKEIEKNLLSMTENYHEYSLKRLSGTVIEQKITQNYLNALNVLIDEASDNLEKQKKVVEDKRNVLIKKQVERKTVEVLKDKQKLEFEKNENLKEQRVNDELALYSFIRNIERG
ncbi:flagellar FliJ protein [Clostridium acetobutylicum]|uniref:Flagellar FliJ protein n=1 Tax=Clostridium acetobutylicum (strain ATCC 824 / DSM 792 / JCM 1419 / IAM 19013 / LMG 5710 / NBRC 13948 / NRRL B-527 / VKM B-1787 / 2291 / W) TaxID=272562 RepID=Q97H55_CLOAB|nr:MULTISPECIES: flagellar export protein FliJ [Clostridium]AAK80116.1 Flagellar protein FliJ [Clostridium acetobutylicum ATCC 824]ADZ21209.1 Flagellar protein FliJ [Clostridium acetobutylicum EA 2018]AEI32205.1 flagellar protein FliJ [Clostridium acetobutylicum DSM 1731]AWV79459.1 flagellar export protein FliJ [Clostridium acetobutylicum]MBC2394570.1 flagellar export protein FliJ [Clostridium acetobutylicum]